MSTSIAPSPRLLVIGESSSARVGADEVGRKALNLMRMTEAGLPVPPAFVLSTAVCRDYHAGDRAPDDLDDLLAEGITALERSTGLEFGGRRRPLLVAARSGAAASMPGMLETVLNLGLCDSTISGLLRASGDPRFVWDSYRRLVRQYGEVVCGLDGARFDEVISTLMRRESVVEVDELDVAALRELTSRSLGVFANAAGEPFPQSPTAQLRGATLAVLRSWRSPRAAAYRRMEHLSNDGGTAVTVQAMVFGNMGATSGTGVGFTRDPATGEDRLYVDFLLDAQGEDLVSGRRGAPDSAAAIAAVPGLAQELGRVRRRLEAVFGDVQDFEFTVQDGRLHLLQSRAARRTPWAALQIAGDLVDEGLIDEQAGLRLLTGIDPNSVSRTRLADGVRGSLLAVGIPASPGVASGPVTLSIDGAQRCAEAGRPAILVRNEPTTKDVAGLSVCAALLTATGARTSHAAVVARQLGRVCVVGCRDLAITAGEGVCRFGSRIVVEGEPLTIDGTTGQIHAGELATVLERPEALIERTKRWVIPTQTGE
jgi:pyruvate, orthophosphate dikinase